MISVTTPDARQKQKIRFLRSFSEKDRFSAPEKRYTLDEIIKKQQADIEREERQLDIKLKRITLMMLFIFLALESLAIFYLFFLQGQKYNSFQMEEWSFRLLVAATITQITYLVRVAVVNLFPSKDAKIELAPLPEPNA